MTQLAKLNSPFGQETDDAASGQPVYHVNNPHLLVQSAGYLKHVLGKNGPCTVALRGQPKLYQTLKPSLYRNIKTQQAKHKRDIDLNEYLRKIRDGKHALGKVDEFVRAPLLQHYGIRTNWLDLVDNIWVALWFACHDAKNAGKFGQYLHFERRLSNKADEFAYILVLHVKTERADPTCPGLWEGDDTQLIDLRIAAPSHFVRPHAQHGLLVARTKHDVSRMDYADLVVGKIRVQLSDALSWLGDGHLLTTRALFPPATYDYGYRELLDGRMPVSKTIGSIQHIGA